MTQDINTQNAVDAQVYFAVIPEWVLDLPISSSAIRVYCCLRRYADNKSGECYPSRRTLAMRSRMSIATVDRALKELVEHGAILQRKRKNNAGDWTSNLYTVLALPMGVATNLALPHTRIAATGKRKSVAQTRPNMNEKQELLVYPLEIPKAEATPTKDGLLATAQQFRELSETCTPTMKKTMLKLSQRFEAQAQEISNETTDSNNSY